MIRPEHQFYIKPDLRKAASTKAESTTAESAIRPKQLVRILQDYIFRGHKLTSESSSKYLGVELHSDMSWRSHIDKTVKKANSTLGFLRRNLKVSNQDTNTAAYKTLVRPTIEYCSSGVPDNSARGQLGPRQVGP